MLHARRSSMHELAVRAPRPTVGAVDGGGMFAQATPMVAGTEPDGGGARLALAVAAVSVARQLKGSTAVRIAGAPCTSHRRRRCVAARQRRKRSCMPNVSDSRRWSASEPLTLPRACLAATLALSWRCPGSKLSHPAHTLQQPPPLSCLVAECPHRSTQLVILE